MVVKFSQLSKELQEEIKSILKGNGQELKDAKFYQDGSKIAIEIKKTGEIIKVNFE